MPLLWVDGFEAKSFHLLRRASCFFFAPSCCRSPLAGDAFRRAIATLRFGLRARRARGSTRRPCVAKRGALSLYSGHPALRPSGRLRRSRRSCGAVVTFSLSTQRESDSGANGARSLFASNQPTKSKSIAGQRAPTRAAQRAPITTGSGSNVTPNFSRTPSITRCASTHSCRPVALP